MFSDPPPNEKKATFRHLPRLALEGVIGNAVWALVVVVAVAIAAKLQGDISAWIFGVSLLLSLGASGFLSSALARDRDRLRGERDEARAQATLAIERAVEIEERTDAEKRELREQLATATGGQQAVSTRMQSIARQADALAQAPISEYGPYENEVELLIALVEDFARIAPSDDPLAKRLLNTWRDSDQGHSHSEWISALQILRARAVSIGTEEALGQ